MSRAQFGLDRLEDFYYYTNPIVGKSGARVVVVCARAGLCGAHTSSENKATTSPQRLSYTAGKQGGHWLQVVAIMAYC